VLRSPPMRSREDIEAYLLRAGHPFEEVAEATWLVKDPEASGAHVVVKLDEGIVLFRMKVLELDDHFDRPALFEKLLQLNATEMLNGAYGISDGNIVLTCALRAENLDFNEFQGVVDDFTMALGNHYETIKSFRKA